jgi:hypothetical protein
MAASPTPPPPIEETFPPDIIAAWLQVDSNVSAVNNMRIFTQYKIGANGLFDDIIGFLFQDNGGQTCAGFAQTTAATATVWNATFSCVPPGIPLIVGSPSPFQLISNGEFYTALYGYVDPSLNPSAGGVAFEFTNRPGVGQNLINGGFVYLHPGIEFPYRLSVVDTGGNLLLQVPIQ